jgi:putative ABC transport system permease protein
MLKLAWRNLTRQRARTAVALSAIVCGVAGLILSGGFVQDVYIQLGEALIHSQSGHIQVSRSGYFEKGTRQPERYVLDDPDGLSREIAAAPEVAQVMRRVSFAGLLNNGRVDLGIVGEGIEPDKEARLGSFLRFASGRPLTDKDNYGIQVGEGVAAALKLEPGQTVTLAANTIEGGLNTVDFEIVGVFQSFSKDYDARAVRIRLGAAQELLNSAGANTLVLELKRTSDTATIAQQLQPRLKAGSLELRTWPQLNDFYDKTVALYRQQFGALQAIILLMVLLSVVNSLNLTLFERTAEFGTMRALGNRSRAVFGLLVTEGALLGLLGAALGVAIGVVVALLINLSGIPMPPPPNANLGYSAYVRLVPTVIAAAFAIGVSAAIAAALLPARRLSRLPVVDALRASQ